MTAKTTVQPQPALLGLKASFGFGDRLGLATPGHIAACRKGRLAPIFAQQSARELTRTRRTAADVVQAAQAALAAAGWTDAWGADGDHLKTREDVQMYAACGYTFYTIDPSAYVNNQADRLSGAGLTAAVAEVVKSGAFASVADIEGLYLNRSFDLGEGIGLRFDDRAALLRGVVKYGRAMAYAAEMAGHIATARAAQGYEIEMSVDETESPTSPLEHLFIGLELRRRKVRVVSLAPRFLGEFEKGVDYKGDLKAFEAALRRHVAIARFCGPYKISIHSGSDKFSIYPIIGRVCGPLLHVKTAGTSYLEALRVVTRVAPALFLEMANFARERYDEDRASYHVSAQLKDAEAPVGLKPAELERIYLDENPGRQVLHVTFGSLLTLGKARDGRPFKTGLLETLAAHPDLHRDLLAQHLGRHIELLSAG